MDDGFKQTFQKKELQGPRPTPLKVRKNSHKIKKPPLLPQNNTENQLRQPLIIYTVSPKVIHTDPTEFMGLVQRLTGTAAAAPPPLPENWHGGGGGGGGVSPAARMAATAAEVEKGSSKYEGILSPCPETLPQAAAGFFTAEMENYYSNNSNTVGFFSSPSFVGYHQMMMNTSPTVCSDLFGFYFDQ